MQIPVTTNGDNGTVPLGATSTPWSVDYGRLTPLIVKAIQQLAQQLTDLANTIAGFADSFTTKQLTFTRATGDEIDVKTANIQTANTQKLCIGSTCVTEPQLQALLAAANQSGTGASGTGSSTPPPSSSNNAASSSTDSSATPPVVQVNGDNPAIIQVGATYNDLGATITGPTADLNLGITTYVNGAPMNPIQLDTTQAATDTIQYVVTDQSGLTSTSTRQVIIEAAEAPSIIPTENISSSTEATSTAQ
jgi:Domain of unknown function (DUF5011)